VRGADPAVARLAREDLERLFEEFSVAPVFEASAGGLLGSRGAFSPDPLLGASSLGFSYGLADRLLISARGVWGGLADSPPGGEVFASFRVGSVLAQLGRASAMWGPSLRTGLLLSDNAGTLPLLRLSAEVPGVRLTKTVAFLGRAGGFPAGDVALFATRLDWLATPRLRLGLGEAVVTAWGGPLTFYHLLQPLPVFSGIVASYDFHDALGQSRNMSVEVDFDWLARPGVRLYGSFFADDAPERIFERRARVGALAGLYLAGPFRTGRTSLRLEYSAVTNGTYSYGSGLEHAVGGHSLGHWLGPDGDELYLEIAHRLSAAATLQFSYAYGRHGQGRIGQPPPPPEDWFLSGVVETRHTFGLQLQQFSSPSLEALYRVEVASVTNRENVPGVNGWDVLAAARLTYRWPSSPSVPAESFPSLVEAPPVGLPGPRVVREAMPARLRLFTWSPMVTSRGPLSGPATTASFVGASYRGRLGKALLSFTYEAGQPAGNAFWAADLHYPIWEPEYGTLSLLAGWGGMSYQGELGGAVRTLSLSTPRLGAAFYYRPVVNGAPAPFYLAGEIASPPLRAILAPREGGAPFYLWTYTIGGGWRTVSGLTLEAGYRGAVATWRVGLPEQTFLRWSGFYLTLSLR
jgi:hypothetical protein